MLNNKYMDIDTILANHHPHVLGLGEANHRQDHDLDATAPSGFCSGQYGKEGWQESTLVVHSESRGVMILKMTRWLVTK